LVLIDKPQLGAHGLDPVVPAGRPFSSSLEISS
jgi:hypothetical protein